MITLFTAATRSISICDPFFLLIRTIIALFCDVFELSLPIQYIKLIRICKYLHTAEYDLFKMLSLNLPLTLITTHSRVKQDRALLAASNGQA